MILSSGASLPEVAGAGGVVTALAAAFGYFLNFIIKRRTSERESESGIVETTNATLQIVRENQEAMSADIKQLRTENNSLREENNDLRYQLRKKDTEIAELRDELGERLDRLEHKES